MNNLTLNLTSKYNPYFCSNSAEQNNYNVDEASKFWLREQPQKTTINQTPTTQQTITEKPFFNSFETDTATNAAGTAVFLRLAQRGIEWLSEMCASILMRGKEFASESDVKKVADAMKSEKGLKADIHYIDNTNKGFLKRMFPGLAKSIDTVANELDGYIGEEFKRMSLELLYGLEIDVVFERFSKRIGLEEANYLTASLTILNKTGGDIIKVFNLIEKNMFDKRKLRLELSSLTSGSRIVVATLLGMPFFFALVISMINKDYFLPLLTTQIGRILLIFMIIYYIIFVVVVRVSLRVRVFTSATAQSYAALM